MWMSKSFSDSKVNENALEEKIKLLEILLKELPIDEAVKYTENIIRPLVAAEQTSDKNYIVLAEKFIELSTDLSGIKNIVHSDATNKKFNKMGIYYSLKAQLNQINYFFGRLVPQQKSKNPSLTFFNPKPCPAVNQMAYFSLGYGYPKEMFGGHFCYILKDLKTKFLVIPSTSVKNDSSEKGDYEIEIIIKNFENNMRTRLQLSDMRTVDKLRFNGKEKIYDVETDTNIIKKEMNKILNLC